MFTIERKNAPWRSQAMRAAAVQWESSRVNSERKRSSEGRAEDRCVVILLLLLSLCCRCVSLFLLLCLILQERLHITFGQRCEVTEQQQQHREQVGERRRVSRRAAIGEEAGSGNESTAFTRTTANVSPAARLLRCCCRAVHACARPALLSPAQRVRVV